MRSISMGKRSCCAAYLMVITACLPGNPPAQAALAPVAFPGLRVFGHSIVRNDDGSWDQYQVRDVGGQFELAKRTSLNSGLGWGAFSHLTNVPNDSATIISATKDATGEIQTHFVRVRGTGTVPNVNLFFDLYQTRSSSNGTQWDPVQVVFEGYVSDMQQSVTLQSGRVLQPFHTFIPFASDGPPTGRSYSTVMYSDDRGASWQISASQLTTPVPAGFNGNTDGAVEPVVIDQPDLGRQWMLIRTQADYLYESFSFDNGTTWSNPTASIFASSDSPADYQWLPDGRLMMFWNNTRNVPRLPNGDGVYSGRDVVHAAISEDGGVTWRGFREFYVDPNRHGTPPTLGDRGVGIPAAVMTKNQQMVAVMTGQGAAAALVYVDPNWLYETSRSSDFSNDLDDWTAFTGVGPAVGFFQDRVIGPEVIAHPTEAGKKVLRLNNPDPGNQAGDGATWNFPMGTKGRVTVRMMITADTKVADIELTDRFLDPTDDTSTDVAVFNLRFNDRGEIVGQEQFSITKDVWHDVAIDWDLAASEATVLVDNIAITTLPMLYSTRTGISYLRLRSPFVSALDPEGWLVDWVDAQVTAVPSIFLDGDLDGDGFVGISDLNILLTRWNQSVNPGDRSAGDLTGDGFVGISDLNRVLSDWNKGTPPGEPQNLIPEPGAAAVLAAGGLTMVRRRRP
jgi:MYXO-CTERM domain-containing protein